MKISELHKKSLELGLELGDTVNLLFKVGAPLPVVFYEILFRESEHTRFQYSKFDYVELSGCTVHYYGSGMDSNFDFDLRYIGIERWEPTSVEEVEAVRKIKEDLKNRTHKYIR